MARYGLAVDYRYCTGCHTCEVACQMEHGLPVGEFGVKVAEVGPWRLPEDRWQLEYFPLPTRQCDLCAPRVEQGKQPTCVQHCMADCLRFGTAEELFEIVSGKDQQAVFIPKQ